MPLNHADYRKETWEIPAEINNPDTVDTMEIVEFILTRIPDAELFPYET